MPADAMLRMSIGLILVVLAILACAWLAKRAGMGLSPSRRLLREVDAMRLGPRQRITLIELDQTWLVVGISAGQMTLLHSQPAGSPGSTLAGVSGSTFSGGSRPTHADPAAPATEPSIKAGFAALLARARSGRSTS